MAINQLYENRKWVAACVLVGILAILPVTGSPKEWLLYGFLFFIYLAGANMWNLLCGYSGLISLCQAGFIGLAGYTMTILTWLEIPFYIGILIGGLVAALFAVAISIPVFRLSGIYFAIGTLVVPEALRIFFLMWRPVGGALHGGGAGYMIKGLDKLTISSFYWMAMVVGIGSILLMRFILRSKLGIGLAAIRDNEKTAASAGINVFRLKLTSFVISGFVTGIAGAIFYAYQGYLEPAGSFSIQWTMALILSTVIGGIATEEGPVIGTAIVVTLLFLLAKSPGISMLIQGAILVVIMRLAPKGIAGSMRNNTVCQAVFYTPQGDST
jgi:branched-chain amino acid transport system permease protein